ncbi:SDR family oxidoreductase [Rhizobium sp. MHM7A]|uniref:SDR family oxidoreductase n=1 Tax=Rhizobium sp. MHM7A TaxID=2583233 RepID=UPI0011074CDB|nr:SDR family oxidoreductase [Rhizobium sp. MHM7A]TLX16220.1 SDR family oxidoreductase [Rhizobium sp. MHM7A]
MAKVLVVGGYGLIGLAIVKKLLDAGHSVRGIGRDASQAEVQEPGARWDSVDISRLHTAEQWVPYSDSADVIINASGALQSGQKDDLKALQCRSITALIDSCRKGANSPKYIQISAPGADWDAKFEFLRTKGEADDYLRQSGLDWCILKPGLVIAPAAYGGTALLRMLASFPFVTPLVYPDSPVGTISIDDVVDVVMAAIDGRVPPGTEMDIVEEHARPLSEVVGLFRSWMGLSRPALTLRLPSWIARVVGFGADILGELGWRSPLRSTSMKVMSEGVIADPTVYKQVMQKSCKSLPETLRGMPSTVQERWFARMFLLFPAMIATLSLFWIASGVIGFLKVSAAATHLTDAGIGQSLAMAVVAAGAFVDIVLGAAVVYRPYVRPALLGMVAVTASYLVAGSLLSPSLWLDPLGPFVKTLPASVMAFVASAFVRSR